MLSSAKTIKGLPYVPRCSSFDLLAKRRYVKVRNFCAVDKSGVLFSGAALHQVSRRLNKHEVCFQAKAGTVLPATDDYVEEAVLAIKAGKVIALPTDTLYGFACDACSVQAVTRIYEIKGRKLTSPLAICVADVLDIPRYAAVDHLPDGLLDTLLPGPVTVVLRRGYSSILEKSLNQGLDSIGVRVPDFNFIRAVARGSESAIALTSANLSGQTSSISIKDFENLWQHCAYVYDGGILPSGRAGSTIVDLVNPGVYKVTRPGSAREQTVEILSKFGLEETS